MTVHTIFGFDGASFREHRAEFEAPTWFDAALDCISANDDAFQFAAAFGGNIDVVGTWSVLPADGSESIAPHNGGGTFTVLGFDLIADTAVVTIVESPHWLAAAHLVIDALEHPTSAPSGAAAASYQFVAALAGEHAPTGTWQDLVASLSESPQHAVQLSEPNVAVR